MFKLFKRKPNYRAQIEVLEGLIEIDQGLLAKARGNHGKTAEISARIKERRHQILPLQLEAERGRA